MIRKKKKSRKKVVKKTAKKKRQYKKKNPSKKSLENVTYEFESLNFDPTYDEDDFDF